MQHSGDMDKKNQTKLMVGIYFKSLVKAIGKVLRMRYN